MMHLKPGAATRRAVHQHLNARPVSPRRQPSSVATTITIITTTIVVITITIIIRSSSSHLQQQLVSRPCLCLVLTPLCLVPTMTMPAPQPLVFWTISLSSLHHLSSKLYHHHHQHHRQQNSIALFTRIHTWTLHFGV